MIFFPYRLIVLQIFVVVTVVSLFVRFRKGFRVKSTKAPHLSEQGMCKGVELELSAHTVS